MTYGFSRLSENSHPVLLPCRQVIAAEGELEASRALRNASDMLLQSPLSIQLRYLQTLELSSVSDCKNSTIVFPMPSKAMIKEFLT